MDLLIGWTVIIAVAALLVVRTRVQRVTVMDYQRALYFRNGKRQAVLAPGTHWKRRGMVWPIDTRLQLHTIPGQEVLTADGVGIKASLVLSYAITDPILYVTVAQDATASVYLRAQVAVRDAIAVLTLEQLLEQRAQLSEVLTERVAPVGVDFGIEIKELEVKDIMLPGELKRIYNRVAEAKQESLADLERARGMAAVTRSLANTAKTYDDHPQLWRMRLLDAMTNSTGNTFVVGTSVDSVLDVPSGAIKR